MGIHKTDNDEPESSADSGIGAVGHALAAAAAKAKQSSTVDPQDSLIDSVSRTLGAATSAPPPEPEPKPVAKPAVQQPTTPVKPQPQVNIDMSNQNPFYTLDEADSTLGRTLGLSSGAVDVNEFKRAVERILEQDPTASKNAYGTPSLIAIEAATLGLPCNVLVITMYADDKITNTKVPMVYTLLMEPGEPLQKRQYSVGNYTVDITTVAGDIYGEEVRTAILTHVKKVVGSSELPIDTGVNVVPHDMDLKDPENENYIRGIAFFAFGALNTAIDINFGQQRYLSLAKSGKQQLSANVNWSGRQLYTAAGMPIRSDVVLTTTKRKNLPGATNITGFQGVTRPLTALAGYVDLFYAPPRVEPSAAPTYSSYGIPANSKVVWYPRLVITRAQPMGKVINMGEVLLALASATLLGQNHNWIRAFQPQRGVTNHHDIGALGYEHEFVPGVREYVNTQDPSFNLPEFLNHTVIDNLFYSMDIEESGDMTWIESVFVEAARGDQDAIDYIYEAANALTGNAFSELFGNSEPLMVPDITRVQLGYYTEGDKKIDIRDIDHLALLNMTGKNGAGLAQKWSNALITYPTDNAMSQVDRQNILSEVAPNAVINRYADRVTFNAKALICLANAVQRAGTTIVYEGDQAIQGTDPRISVQYAQFGQGAGASTTLFQNGYAGQQNRSPRNIHTPVGGNIWNGRR